MSKYSRAYSVDYMVSMGSPGEKIIFTRIDTHRAMSTYNHAPIGLENHARPYRAMANLIRHELARGQAEIPANIPRIVP